MANPSPDQSEARSPYAAWLTGPLAFMALLVIARFGLEVAGVSQTTTRLFSSSLAVLLVAIYLGAVAPLRGVRKSVQVIIPGFALAAWTEAWVILFTLLSGWLRLSSSHFAEAADWASWAHLRHHIFEHMAFILPLTIVVLALMALPLVSWRWPVTVTPAALLGALVMIRFWAEALGLSPTVASAWSSSVAFLLCGFYLGGIGPRLGLATYRRLLLPALVLGWTWRLWIFMATLMTAAAPGYTTHFFNRAGGSVAARLLGIFGGEVLVVGLIAGLVLWGIACWTLWVVPAPRPA
jgi:hypothetical protein